MPNGFQKMIAMPAESSNVDLSLPPPEADLTTSKATQRRVNTFFDKLNKIMKIFLKLASIKGYDIIGRVRDSNGHYIPESNIINLINHAMTHGKLLLAQNEFIKLLHEANVEPDLIINENIKVKLLNLYTPTHNDPVTPQSMMTQQIEEEVDEHQEPTRPKRIPKKRIYKQVEQNENLSNEDNNDVSVSQPKSKKRKSTWEVIDESPDGTWDYSPHG